MTEASLSVTQIRINRSTQTSLTTECIPSWWWVNVSMLMHSLMAMGKFVNVDAFSHDGGKMC